LRMSDQQLGTLVIGGSQAGLTVGYHLMRRRLRVVIVDDNDRIGDAWRKRWDSLRLFTPGRYDGLPGMSFPGSPSSYPSRDEIADYLVVVAHPSRRSHKRSGRRHVVSRSLLRRASLHPLAEFGARGRCGTRC
jgi:cation diffusion facilitator CzcD-associated flavoprotein CzcO